MTFTALDDNGQELDAKISIEQVGRYWAVTFESRGGPTGGREPRNTKYHEAVRLTIKRLAAANATLINIEVVSRDALKLKESERQVRPDKYALPLLLNGVADIEGLRLAIARGVGRVGQRPGAKGGNGQKRLRLTIDVDGEEPMSGEGLESLIATGETLAAASVDEEPTSDHDELHRRVSRLRSKSKAGAPKTSPPKGNDIPETTTVPTKRFVRDPRVVAHVLDRGKGRCEVCNSGAPFVRADGSDYFEVHHIVPLAAGGPDTVRNAVACCPNCHREMHSGADAEDLRARLRSKVAAWEIAGTKH